MVSKEEQAIRLEIAADLAHQAYDAFIKAAAVAENAGALGRNVKDIQRVYDAVIEAVTERDANTLLYISELRKHLKGQYNDL